MRPVSGSSKNRSIIDILMITHNRPIYTLKTLGRLLDTCDETMRVWVWQNGNDKETIEVVSSYKKHPRFYKYYHSVVNKKLNEPTVWLWQNSDSKFLSKVDDDCLVSENWCGILEQAHKDIPKAGIVGCWHFLPEDFNKEIAQKKIQKFGVHKILRNCWVGGSGYLMKRKVINKIGYLKENESFTGYCIRAAANGFINGWYYPFLYQEHMDDPRTPHTGIKSDGDFQRLLPLSAKTFNIQTREEWIQRLKTSAKNLQEYSINPKDFIGIKPKIKKKIFKLFGKHYFPRFIKSI